MMPLAWAADAPAATPQPPLFQMFLPLVIIGLIFYFLVFRPEAKKQKQHKMMLESLKKGDRVLTSGGIYGVVVGIHEKEEIVILKIAENVKVEVSKGSIASVQSREGGAS